MFAYTDCPKGNRYQALRHIAQIVIPDYVDWIWCLYLAFYFWAENAVTATHQLAGGILLLS